MTFEEKSQESIKAGEALFEGEMYSSCVNREYYGMFQLILHKLYIGNKLETVQEEGKKSEIGTHNYTMDYFLNYTFKRGKEIRKKIRARSKMYELKDLRHLADYTSEKVDIKIAEKAINNCKEFMNIVK